MGGIGSGMLTVMGCSRVFVGPGEVRDPCVIAINGRGICITRVTRTATRNGRAFICALRMTCYTGPIARLVHSGHDIASGRWSHECPHVVRRGGNFYLMRTADYATAASYVFRSDDPADFGIGAAALEKYVGPLAVAAPEIIVDAAGREYITSNHNLRAGTQLCRLVWDHGHRRTGL